ncbi:MAG: polymer-forming cytoskeletal protein [Vicinamibacterales bacterium]
MSHLGPGTTVKGELRSGEDLTVDGRIEGPIWCEGAAVIVGPTAHVLGDVIARDITVFGHTEGQLIATDVVDVRAHATVTGHVMSRRFILDEAARFEGRAEPQHLDAALRVAQYRRQKREAAAEDA